MEYDMILVRFGEMTLKKDNYKTFLNRILVDIKDKLSEFKNITYYNEMYRFYIELNGENYNDVIAKLKTVCGLHSFSLCKRVNNDMEEIALVAYELLKDKTGDIAFKVETNRGDKSFPLTSIEISKKVSSILLPKLNNYHVDVHNPEVILNIDLRKTGSYIFTDEIYGIGGYPAGIGGKGLVMMSGGLDSPVASFLCIKKGVNVSAIHFSSPPYTSLNSLQKVVDLLQEISKYAYKGTIKLYVVPFTKVQEKIHTKANNVYMITLMRRAMYKIASEVVKKHYLDCIINGESIGQVASQTLESMRVVNDVTNIPIIRPLATYDKLDIIKIAKDINTYDISIRPYEDCCTVFVPKHPAIKPRMDEVLIEEEKCDMNDEILEAIENIKEYDLSYKKKINLLEEDGDLYNI